MMDRKIREAALRELEREPLVKSTGIGVAVKDGIVTLSGFVDSNVKRYNAERAAKRVSGVKAVVNDLEVKLPYSEERMDEDIVRAAGNVLEDRVKVPHERYKVKVREGGVTYDYSSQMEGEDERRTTADAHPISEEMVDEALDLTFPASDPPFWMPFAGK